LRLLKSTLKIVIGELAPFIIEIGNCSLSTGCVPEVFKEANITMLLKRWIWMNLTSDHIYQPFSDLETAGEAHSATTAGTSQLF